MLCLFLLNAQKSIAEVIKQIKGSASHWVNEQNLIPEKFAWQSGYGAYSVRITTGKSFSNISKTNPLLKLHFQKRMWMSC